jgi:hypothetical protein
MKERIIYKNMSNKELIDMFWDNEFQDRSWSREIHNGCKYELSDRGINVLEYLTKEYEE